jgi:hypothetical protein
LDGRNITSLSDVANINTLASEEAIAYTNGICDSDSCTATDVQGSADAACFENVSIISHGCSIATCVSCGSEHPSLLRYTSSYPLFSFFFSLFISRSL